MPRLCSFGCPPSDGVTMHCFPNPNKFPERFRIWVELVGGKLETNADYEYFKKKRVCDIHFTNNHRNRFKRLNALAVPSLHLPGSSRDLEQVPVTPALAVPSLHLPGSSRDLEQVPVTINEENMTSTSDPVPAILEQSLRFSNTTNQFIDPYRNFQRSSSGASQYAPHAGDIIMEHNYSSFSRSKRITVPVAAHRKPIYQSEKIQKEIKYLRSEVCRLRKKNLTFKERLAVAEKCSTDIKFQQVAKNMTKPAQLFMRMQLQAGKKSKGRRFQLKEKILSLSLYKKSPKCYALLCKYFTLPSAKSMKRLVSQIKITEGINNILFEKIKKTMANKEVPERLCSLIFDEMSLTPQLFFNSQKDKIEGFTTDSDTNFADHVLVFMIKGVKHNFKQPVAYYFTKAMTKIELKKMIKIVVSHIQKAGIIVINTVCDQSTVNTGAITDLVAETKENFIRLGKEWRHDQFKVNGQSIIPIYDPPHLIKGIRNNLLNKDMKYTINNQEKTVKWEFFQKVYAADKSCGELRLLSKLTEEHLDPEKINKMRVKLATQVFSHTVAVVTDHLAARGDLPNECRQLVDITLLIDNVFDSLNINSLTIPNGKIYKGPVKRFSPHHQLWVTAKTIFKTVKFIKKQNTSSGIHATESVIPSIKNLIKTIEGMEAIWEVLSQKYRFDCLLTRNLNQDPVENFFGNIRSYGVRNVAPNTISFEGAYKSLLLNNYNAPHSNRANCENDSNRCLQNLKFFFTEKKLTSDIPKNDHDEIFISNDIISGLNKEIDAGQCNYVCGWALTKYLKNAKCSICRYKLVDKNGDNPNNEFIKKKEYKNNKKWLCYPTIQLENCFRDIQNIAHTLLKQNVTKKNVLGNILSVVDVFVTLPSVCTEHTDHFKNYFVKTTVRLIIYSWCRSVNRILSGKINYQGDDQTKLAAQIYYNKRKHYKNKK